MSQEDPIQNLEQFDILGKRRDGGVDMVIVVSSTLHDSEEHRMLFMKKLENYVNASRSEEFEAEFGAGPYRIIARLSDEPDDSLLELFEKARLLLEDLEIDFKYEY